MSLRLCADVTATDTDEALVLLDGRKGRYWQLNSTGSLILRALLDGASEEEVAHRLTQTRPVSAETATRDVGDLVTRLAEARLVERRAAS